MKKFNITVNGKSYAVEVEEVGAGQGGFTYQPVQSAPQVAPAVQAAPQPTQPAPTAQAAPQVAKSPEGPVSGELITAPMPGTILDIKVSEGQAIKAGDIILILEAMKMENEILAPKAGVLTQLPVAKGATVDTGDILFFIK